MLLEVWLALFAAGVLTSIAAYGTRTAPLYAALLNIPVWLVLAIAALDVTVVTNTGETVSMQSPAVAVLAVVNAIASIPVAFAAATGQYGDADGDGTDAPMPSMTDDRRRL